ncbi:MAG: bifunctional folylpolyglutamate synthase/dihydrofolate synthase [Anaerolineales bacterium]|nr:bifunctional folylpolyglutamate synthase/dihydrofolate synthase [Anaerolineales bacterium]
MEIEKNYQEALDYLYSFVDYSLSKSFRYSPVKFELTHIESLVKALGNPQNRYPTIHIAGTKGKGSIAAMCSSVLKAAGYKVGLYTSPHLHDYAERIQVNGTPISHQDLIDLLEEIKPIVNTIPEITTFEITTALGFLYFARQQVDVAVVEVGLGGRLDATNVVMPVVSVITSISYDHTYLLGNSLAEIATEKAGIIKANVPVVVAPQEEEARLTIEKIAKKRAAQIIQVGKDYHYSMLEHNLDGQSLLVWRAADQPIIDQFVEAANEESALPERIFTPLLGYHQVENAATAYATLQTFQMSSLPISIEAIHKGFREINWPGRFEVLQRQPPIAIDCAHNRDSARKLRLALDDYFPGMGIVMVFGASEDKDLHGMFTELIPRVQQVIATKSFHPRAMDPDLIVDMAHQFGKPAKVIDEVGGALLEARKIAGDEMMVLITGSIFVAAVAREAWNDQTKLTGD